MATTLERLEVGYASNVAAQAAADQAALDGAAAAMQRLADATDQTVRRAGPSLESVSNKIDGAAAAATRAESVNRRYAASFDTVNAAVANGSVNAQQGAVMLQRLTMARDQDLQKAAAYGQTIEDRFTRPTDRATVSAGNAAFATRDFGVQMIQAISGIASGQPVLTTLIQQGHQVVDVALATGTGLGGVANAAKSMGAAIGSFVISPIGLVVTAVAAAAAATYAFVSASESAQKATLGLQNQLRATRDDYVSMAAEVQAAAKNLAASTGLSTPDALAAGKAIASQPNFQGTQAQLESLIRTAADLAAVMGTTVPQAAGELVKALQDPAKEAQDLAQKHFPGMSYALADTIKQMEASGHTAEAFGRTLSVIQSTTSGAAENGLTPLQRALQNLGDRFTSTGQGGRSFADLIGERITGAATAAINAVSTIIAAVQRLENFAGSTAAAQTQSQIQQEGGIALPWWTPLPPGPGGRLPSPWASIPDITVHSTAPLPVPPIPPAGGQNYQFINDAVGAAINTVASSPQGHINDLTEELQRYKTALADLGPRTSDNAVAFDKLTTAIAVDNKALSDAQKQLSPWSEGLQKVGDQLDAQTKAQTALTAAYAQGQDAVNKVMATQAAEQQLIDKGLKPSAAGYQRAVDDLTASELKLIKAKGADDFSKQIKDTNDATQAQLAINAAYDGTQDSLDKATNYQRALQLAVKDFGNDAPRHVQDYADALDHGTAAANALKQAQASVQAVTDALGNAFDQLGQGIVNAFLSGSSQAVNFGNIVKSVIASLLTQFAKLAIINPLQNSLFGTSNPTLGIALNTLTNSGSGSAAGILGGAGGSGSLLNSASNLLSLGGITDQLGLTNIGQSLGITGPNGLLSSLGLTGNGGLLSGVSSLLATPLWTTAALTSSQASALGLSALSQGAYGAGSIGASVPGVVSIGGLLGGAGAGFGLGSLLNRLVGGKSTGGTVGSGLGAAAGAAIGSIIPGIGTLIGGLIGGAGGGLLGGLIGPPKPNSWAATGLAIQNGQLVTTGETHQVQDSNQAQVQQEIDQINTTLQALGVQIAGVKDLTSQGKAFLIGNDPKRPDLVGSTIAGHTVSDIFSDFSFNAPGNDTLSKFLSSKGPFGSLSDLASQVQQFEQAQSAISDFLSNTVTGLKSFGQQTGSLNDQIAQIGQQFQAAITSAQQYIASGAATADQTQQLTQAMSDLSDAQGKAIKSAEDAAVSQFSAEDSSFYARYLTAAAQISGNPQDARTAALEVFDVQAQQQRDQLSQQMISVWGDSITSTQNYANQMGVLEKTLGEERLAIAKQYDDQIAQQQQAAADAAAQAAQQAADAQAQAAAQAAQALQAANDNAAQAAGGIVQSITSYLAKYQIGSASPLSPTAQLSLATNQFNSVASAAATGDITNLQQFTSAADAYASAAKAVYGSGAGYAAAVNRILDAAAQLSTQSADTLTASVLRSETRTQTQVLSGLLQDLINEVSSLRAEVRQQSSAPLRAAAA